VKSADLVPFIETLGAINAGMKDQKSAVEAYRKALKLEPESINSKIGLAAALALGSPEERKEAARLASDADAAAKLAGNVSAKRLKQLADTLELLKPAK
jgi:cytochrome c-type biogenesis protein CcmH/NrfG